MIPLLAAVVLGQGDVAAWEARVKRQPNAANWRRLADAYVDAEIYDKAANAFDQASRKYAQLGDPNAAKALVEMGKRWRTEIVPFYERPSERGNLAKYYTAAKWEPMYGCYVGAFIDREDEISSTFMGDSQVYRDPQFFNVATGKHHASFFTYSSYGRRFPKIWAERLKRRRSAAQIAFEPRDLNQVQDDAYLRQWARAAHASGIPIFLRFASEMNGTWVRYTGNPSLYIQKFRLIHRVMEEEAPNVAMVWCPAEIPEYNIDQYFPGDDAVDWVAVNFYAVIYNDADRARSAVNRHPADALDYIYRKYSPRHPMMVGEWAATYQSKVDSGPRPDFAIDKIGQFFAALPRKYPRVKAVHWLSLNTFRHAQGPRKLNNFSLLENLDVMHKYQAATASDYYLTEVEQTPPFSPMEYVPLANGATVARGSRLTALVKTYEQRPTVTWKVDGKVVQRETIPSDYALLVDFPAGKHTVELSVTDSKGRTAGVRKAVVSVG